MIGSRSKKILPRHNFHPSVLKRMRGTPSPSCASVRTVVNVKIQESIGRQCELDAQQHQHGGPDEEAERHAEGYNAGNLLHFLMLCSNSPERDI
jgi:hypothetical protein